MSVIIKYNGNLPVYRHYVTYPFGSVQHEVFPLNFLKTSLVDEREKGKVFYRRKFSGKLTFGSISKVTDEHGVIQDRKDDWILFWGIEQAAPCERLDYLITKTVAGVTTTYWEGYFSTTEGEFDIDKCLFSVLPLTEDDYSIWFDKGDDEYNMATMPIADVPFVTTEVTRGVTTWTYTRNRYLLDVIEYIVDDILAGTGVSSTFLTDATNPVTLDDNRMLYLTLAQKFDIKYPTATTGAAVAMVSFNSLMRMLECMNLRWDYDGSDIIIEHVSFAGFPPVAGGIDIRTQALAVASNKYRYTKEDMPKYERFNWSEADTYFMAQPIWYDSPCVNQDPNSNYIDNYFDLTTDIEYIEDCMADTSLESSISDDGFVLLCNRLTGGNLYVQVAELPVYTPIVAFNGDLSWTSLHEYYFRHDRVLITGYLNGTLETFYTAKRTKQQDVNIIECSAFDPTEDITSELGETYFSGIKAQVQKASIEPTGLVKLSLIYGVEDNNNVGRTPPKTIRIVEIADAPNTISTFYFTLSEPATDNGAGHIEIKMKIWCKDAGGNVCDSAWTSCIINVGDLTGSCTIDWCEDSICIQSIDDFDMTLAPGWETPYVINDIDSIC